MKFRGQKGLTKPQKIKGFQTGGGFPIWTCPSFLSFLVLFGTFPICLDFPDWGMVWGFSRSVLFLFFSLLTAPTRNSLEKGPRHNLDHSQKKGETHRFGTPGLASPFFVLFLVGLEAKGLLAFQGRRRITSVVRWNLRPVIFGVE